MEEGADVPVIIGPEESVVGILKKRANPRENSGTLKGITIIAKLMQGVMRRIETNNSS